MVMRLFFAILLGSCALARAQDIEPGDMTLRVFVEELPYTPFEEEMVLLNIHGAYKIPISLEKLEQPALDGFDWMQLGHDDWYETDERGRKVVNFRRVMALFPNRSGTIEIGPFTHRLELVTKTGKRYDRDVRSEPITLDVLPKPVTADWWLPVRRIAVEDSWSNSPHNLGTGEGALRILRLDIRGVKPATVPPMPELEVAGAKAFAHPEKRFEKLDVRGPRALIFWRWTVRPDEPPSAYLKPLRIPYFDSVAREHKEIVIAAQRISMTDEAIAEYERETGRAVTEDAGRPLQEPRTGYAGMAPPVALGVGLLAGLALMLPGFRLRNRDEALALARRWLPDPDVKALKRAARRGDAAATRAAAIRLMPRANRKAREALAEFDSALYGAAPSEPDCRKLAKSVLSSLAG